jgi:hypothetical protein
MNDLWDTRTWLYEICIREIFNYYVLMFELEFG